MTKKKSGTKKSKAKAPAEVKLTQLETLQLENLMLKKNSLEKELTASINQTLGKIGQRLNINPAMYQFDPTTGLGTLKGEPRA
jgi:hypothetical protein